MWHTKVMGFPGVAKHDRVSKTRPKEEVVVQHLAYLLLGGGSWCYVGYTWERWAYTGGDDAGGDLLAENVSHASHSLGNQGEDKATKAKRRDSTAKEG